MVHFNTLLFASLALSLSGVNGVPAPLSKRIAQTISASTTKWVAACTAAGGGQQCGQISINAFTTLLAAGDPCDHQTAADNMIDLAKTLKNNTEVIQLAQVFAQQPRNAPDSLSVLYCQQAPKNAELKGLFQCQFQGCNPTVFTGNVKVGAPGTIPFGMSAALSPAGSCPANPNGPIADGSQLTDITTNPGVPSNANTGGNNNNNGGNNNGNGGNNNGGGGSGNGNNGGGNGNGNNNGNNQCGNGSGNGNGNGNSQPTPASSASNPASTAAAGGDPSKPFLLQNGKDAIAANQKFAALNATSSCTDGQDACVESQFAQCVGGKFELTACAGGTICAVLPLVNKAGTSIACTTVADRDARIAATGA